MLKPLEFKMLKPLQHSLLNHSLCIILIGIVGAMNTADDEDDSVNYYQTRCSLGCSTNTSVTDSLSQSVSHICDKIFETPTRPNHSS